jgi:hypothetical protein
MDTILDEFTVSNFKHSTVSRHTLKHDVDCVDKNEGKVWVFYKAWKKLRRFKAFRFKAFRQKAFRRVTFIGLPKGGPFRSYLPSDQRALGSQRRI